MHWQKTFCAVVKILRQQNTLRLLLDVLKGFDLFVQWKIFFQKLIILMYIYESDSFSKQGFNGHLLKFMFSLFCRS